MLTLFIRFTEFEGASGGIHLVIGDTFAVGIL